MSSKSRKRNCCRFFAFLLFAIVVAVGTLIALHFTKVINIPFLPKQGASSPEPISGGPGNPPIIDPTKPYEDDSNIRGPRVMSLLNKKLTPPKNGIMFGGWLYGDRYTWIPTVEQYNSRLGYNAATIGIFVNDTDPTNVPRLTEAANTAKKSGSVLIVSWEPFLGLETVNDAYITTMILALKPINDLGVPILLRWAHEMNGGWYKWGQKPSLYKSTWIRMATAVKANLPLASLMWAPNSANGAPFSGPESPAANSAAFKEMDTNGNGRWDVADDPFEPFYPGDEYVDWVGLSLFWYGNTFPYNENLLPPKNYLVDVASGACQFCSPFSFYDNYAVKRNKPFAIIETSAPFYTSASATGLTDKVISKRQWMQQLFGEETRKRFPLLKAVTWFEFQKSEDGNSRDFSLTNNTELVNAVKSDWKDWPIVFAKTP